MNKKMYNAPALKKAIQILKILVEDYQPMGVVDVAKRIMIGKSTAYGILKSFQEEGLISKNLSTKKYTIGKEMMRLSKMVLRRQDLAFIARPCLERLAQVTDETVFLGIREDDAIKAIDIVEAEKEFKISSTVGAKLPLTAGAVGKIFLSAMSNEEMVAYIAEKGLPQYTENSITDSNSLIKEIEKIRKLGYSLDNGEYLKGIRAVASLIYQCGSPIGAIWLVGFSNSILDRNMDHIIRNLKYTAEHINDRLSVSSAILKDSMGTIVRAAPSDGKNRKEGGHF